MAKKAAKKSAKNYRRYVLNCDPSAGTGTDWGFADAVSAGVASAAAPPAAKDLRETWWKVRDQGSTGACVGFAAADGVLRWHFVRARKIAKKELLAPRFIWMANKETDAITQYPTTFIDSAGTQTKRALGVARNYGAVTENILPMNGGLSRLSTAQFYTIAARLRISSYHNLGNNPAAWRRWLAFNGPILTRLGVDRTWDKANGTKGRLDTYLPHTVRGGHAVCMVGYDRDKFIIRNSWGPNWGDKGFAHASNAYAEAAFTEAYGAVI